MRFKTWMIEIRAPFLLLPLILAAVGTVLAAEDGHLNVLNFAIFTAILLLLHISVNTLNEYYDHRSGIDMHTRRTMFNGGTGILQAGLLTPKEVLTAALLCFAIASVLSVYLLLTVSLLLLAIIIPGMIFTAFYTQIFARGMMGEIAAGLGLGSLPVIGAYLVQVQELPLSLVLMAIPSGILTFNLLLLNEFPDVEADIAGGRRNLVISLGSRRSAWLFLTGFVGVYGIILAGIALSVFPLLAVIALLTLPFAHKAVKGAFEGADQISSFAHALKANVEVVLITQILFVVGFTVALAV